MKTDQIMCCIVALILGMLMYHMLQNVCGCKNVVEGVDEDEVLPEVATCDLERIRKSCPEGVISQSGTTGKISKATAVLNNANWKQQNMQATGDTSVTIQKEVDAAEKKLKERRLAEIQIAVDAAEKRLKDETDDLNFKMTRLAEMRTTEDAVTTANNCLAALNDNDNTLCP